MVLGFILHIKAVLVGFLCFLNDKTKQLALTVGLFIVFNVY